MVKGESPGGPGILRGPIVHFGGNAPNEHLRDTVLCMC